MTQMTALVLGVLYTLYMWRRYVLRRDGRIPTRRRIMSTREKAKAAAIVAFYRRRRA
jgi:hypothetical protein